MSRVQLCLNVGPAGTINHLGVEVATTGEVTRAEARLAYTVLEHIERP